MGLLVDGVGKRGIMCITVADRVREGGGGWKDREIKRRGESGVEDLGCSGCSGLCISTM